MSPPPPCTHSLCAVHTLATLTLQLPTLHDARLVSLLGTLMSAAYCLIAVVMCATIKHTEPVNYNPAAVDRSTVARIMGIFNAMTTIFFAYGGHNVALEIQVGVGLVLRCLQL